MILSSETNLYEILEISFSASNSTIKAAYRRLARRYHPDLNSGDKECIKKFKEITEAYEILSDAEKKKNYDITKGFYRNNSQAKRNEANKAYRETHKETSYQTNSKETKRKNYTNEYSKNESLKKDSIFSNVFNDILEGFKKTTSYSQNQKDKNKQTERGRDVYTDVKITIIEALHGTTRTINILHTEQCTHCEGRVFENGSRCTICNGDGEHSTHRKLTVKIPPHIKNGSRIRIANEGNKGYNGGKNGDLYLNIKVDTTYNFEKEANFNFTYDGLNILYTIPIEPFEAVLGASIDIPTPKGKVSMKILPNTQSGQKFRLSSQGLEKNGKIGDMIVTVNIEIPKNLSAKEIELYKQLRNITEKK